MKMIFLMIMMIAPIIAEAQFTINKSGAALPFRSGFPTPINKSLTCECSIPTGKDKAGNVTLSKHQRTCYTKACDECCNNWSAGAFGKEIKIKAAY